MFPKIGSEHRLFSVAGPFRLGDRSSHRWTSVLDSGGWDDIGPLIQLDAGPNIPLGPCQAGPWIRGGTAVHFQRLFSLIEPRAASRAAIGSTLFCGFTAAPCWLLPSGKADWSSFSERGLALCRLYYCSSVKQSMKNWFFNSIVEFNWINGWIE